MVAIAADCPKLHGALIDLALVVELGLGSIAQREVHEPTQGSNKARVKLHVVRDAAHIAGDTNNLKISMSHKSEKMLQLHAKLEKMLTLFEAQMRNENMDHLHDALCLVKEVARLEIS